MKLIVGRLPTGIGAGIDVTCANCGWQGMVTAGTL
jgi:hypothetical protein